MKNYMKFLDFFSFFVVGFPCSSTLSFYYKDYILFENKFKQDGNVKILLGSLKKIILHQIE